MHFHPLAEWPEPLAAEAPRGGRTSLAPGRAPARSASASAGGTETDVVMRDNGALTLNSPACPHHIRTEATDRQTALFPHIHCLARSLTPARPCATVPRHWGREIDPT